MAKHKIREDILLVARKIPRNSQNIPAYYMLNHPIRRMYFICMFVCTQYVFSILALSTNYL